MGAAVTRGDLVYAKSRRFQTLLEDTKKLCDEYMEKYPMSVAFSGGKDSTVMLSIMQDIDPEIRSVFFDSGLEFPETYDMIEYHNSDIVYPELSMRDMLHEDGMFECEPCKPEAIICCDYSWYLVVDPSIKYCAYTGQDTIAIGLRANESKGRLANFNFRGFYYTCKDQPARFLPMSKWSEDDIWAYIALKGCNYNKVYDLMSEHKIPRNEQRVSVLIGGRGANHGRYGRLKMIKPQLFNELCAEFPGLSRYI